jgi:hypothetical protein
MKTLLERVIYQPVLILPLLVLTQLMVALDFSLSQVTLVLLIKSARVAYRWTVRRFIYVSLKWLRACLRSLSQPGDTIHGGCGCKG